MRSWRSEFLFVSLDVAWVWQLAVLVPQVDRKGNGMPLFLERWVN